MSATTAPRREDYTPLTRVRSIQDALRHPEMVKRMTAAVPAHMNPDRMLRVMALAVARTANLDKCPVMELLGAFLMLGSLGLEPNGPLGHAYLIPFAKRKQVDGKWEIAGYQLQIVIGYTGYLELARRTGEITNQHADVVYEGDEFDFSYGTDAHLRHVPKGDRKRTPLYAYCHLKLRDGGQAFTVLPWAHVLEVRNASEGYINAKRARDRKNGKGEKEPAWAKNPWVAHEHPMAAKTAVRALRPYMPLSIEMARAMEVDERGNLDWGSVINAEGGEREITPAETEEPEDAGEVAGEAPADERQAAQLTDDRAGRITIPPREEAGAEVAQPRQEVTEKRPIAAAKIAEKEQTKAANRPAPVQPSFTVEGPRGTVSYLSPDDAIAALRDLMEEDGDAAREANEEVIAKLAEIGFELDTAVGTESQKDDQLPAELMVTPAMLRGAIDFDNLRAQVSAVLQKVTREQFPLLQHHLEPTLDRLPRDKQLEVRKLLNVRGRELF